MARGMHGVEEQQAAGSAVAHDLDHLESRVGCQIPRACMGGAVRTGRAEGEAALQDAGTKGFRVGEEWRDGAVALDSRSASAIETQFLGAGGMGAGVGDGIHDGSGDAGGEEIEKFGVEIGQGSGEGVVDFGGSEIGGPVVSVGCGEYQFLRFEALAAID